MVNVPSEVELPKLRIEIDEIRWDSKNAVDILKESMVLPDNWNKIRGVYKELFDANDFDAPDTKNTFVQLLFSFEREVESLGDMMMDEDADAENFE